MFIYLSLALVAITLLIVLINIIKGLIRGLKKTIGTLIAIIISAVIAAIVTIFVCDPESAAITAIMDLFKSMFTEGELKEIFGIEELTESLSYYISMIAAPFIFMSLYAVLSIIIAIVVGILVKIIPPFKKPNIVLHRLGGVGVGLICGLLVSALLLMPVVGVVSVAITVGTSETIAFENPDSEIVVLAEEGSDDTIFAVYSASSGWLFDLFASANYDGEKIYLKDDVDVIITVIGNMGEISGDVSEFNDKQIEALDNIVGVLDDSALLKNTLAGMLSHLASKWVAGESFIGVARIDAGELLNPVIDSVLEVLATSSKDTITADMTTLVDIIEVMIDYKLLENVDNFEKILEVLSDAPEGEESAIEALINVANANPRMSGLSDEITQLSIRALASTLGIPVDSDERYDMLMDDIASVLNESLNAEDREAYVKENVAEALDSYGVNIDGDAADEITSSMLADLGDLSVVESGAVKEFFMIYAVSLGSLNETKYGYSGLDLLSAEEDDGVTADPSTGEIKLGDYVFKYYNAASYTESAAYIAGQNNLDFGSAATLYSADSMESNVITLEDIFNAGEEGEKAKKFSELSADEAKEEAKKFSEMLSMVGDLFGDDFDNIDYKQMVKNMGGVLDKMSDMQTLGGAATAELVKAVFQSEAIVDSLGIPSDQLEDRALDLINNAKREDSSYSTATKAIGGMLEMIDKVNDKGATKEEKIETTKELMTNMTPANAEMLSNMATPEMMKDYVKDETKAESVSNSVSSLFTNMSKLETEDDEEYKKESEAVNTVLNLAMDSADSTHTSLFTTVDENGNVVEEGKMDTDAAGFVSLVTGSKVVSQTVKETVESGENPYGIDPSAEDEAVLSDALVDHYAAEKENLSAEELEELKETLTSIAMISNIEVPEFD